MSCYYKSLFALESMFKRFEPKMELKFACLDSRLDSFDLRLLELEQNAYSRDIRIAVAC